VWKWASPAHHLIGLLRINAKAKRERHSLVKFGGREFLQRRNGIGETVVLRPIYLLRRGAITFASICWHCSVQFKRRSLLWQPGSCLIIPLTRANGTPNLAAISALSKSHPKKLQSISIG
jgi:hypothetical protein